MTTMISLLKAKIHHARVTDANVNYVGSITIDPILIEQAGLYVYEKVLVADVENGNRLETYVIEGERGKGEIVLNGAAAHLVNVGDRVIIMAFAQVEVPPPTNWSPRVLVCDEKNQVVEVIVL
jgi:aspartate 1-decarboxylase